MKSEPSKSVHRSGFVSNQKIKTPNSGVTLITSPLCFHHLMSSCQGSACRVPGHMEPVCQSRTGVRTTLGTTSSSTRVKLDTRPASPRGGQIERRQEARQERRNLDAVSSPKTPARRIPVVPTDGRRSRPKTRKVECRYYRPVDMLVMMGILP